jgi:hypothetical protein
LVALGGILDMSNDPQAQMIYPFAEYARILSMDKYADLCISALVWSPASDDGTHLNNTREACQRSQV